MKYLNIGLPLLAVGIAVLARPAYAHGFGERTELPVPLGFFLIGAGAAVAFSFALIGVFVRSNTGHRSYWRYNLYQHRWLRATLTSPLLLMPLKLLSVFLLGLVIAAGLFGDQTPALNFAPTFVWIIWWVGMAYVAALVGSLWVIVNPWKILFEWAQKLCGMLRPGCTLVLNWEYPRAWGIWPAILLFLCFTWIQDVYSQSPLPDRVAVMAIAYSAITLAGMTLFGKHQWLRHGEAFSVVFGFLARFAPTEVRVRESDQCRRCDGDCRDKDGECVNCYECFERAGSKELNVRPLAIGLARNERKTNDVLAMVVLLIATVTFDGFSATRAWVDFQSYSMDILGGLGGNDVFNGISIANTLGVALFPVAFFLVYITFAFFMSGAVEKRLGTLDLARVFAYSLIPIALAYNIAHFITLLLIQGQLIIPLASDPFGYDWNLLGTGEYRINIGVINARILWYLSVGVIVLGHIMAVYLAHLIAIRTFQDRAIAINSQYPMMLLMVIYTMVSLWIIAQPIVA